MAATAPRAPRSRGLSDRRAEMVAGLVLIAIPMFFFLSLRIGAIGYAGFISLWDWGLRGAKEFEGTRNFERILADPVFHKAIGNTLYYTAFNVPGTILLSLALAMMLLRVGRASGLFRTAFYLPNMTPAVAVGTLFLLLLAGQGLLNGLLRAVGLPGPNWLTDPSFIKPAIIIMSLWTLGSTVVIYFAALRNVPLEIYEAARIDGANAWQQFRSITLPYISGAIFFMVIVNTIASLQIFAEVYTMFFGPARSGPGQESALFYTIYLFRRAFEDLDLGYASALAWVLFVIILIITVIQVVISRRLVFYAGDNR